MKFKNFKKLEIMINVIVKIVFLIIVKISEIFF